MVRLLLSVRILCIFRLSTLCILHLGILHFMYSTLNKFTPAFLTVLHLSTYHRSAVSQLYPGTGDEGADTAQHPGEARRDPLSPGVWVLLGHPETAPLGF